MRNDPVSPVVLAAALSACALEPGLLNSERIGERFGSYGIEILDHESGVRRSSLYSIENDRRVCRTYAVVEFLDQASRDVVGAHEEVLAGNSIGATFKATGWQIRKETLHVGSMPLKDSQHAIAVLMHLDESAILSTHAYRLILEKNSRSVHYATIIETHHPEYLTESELHQLYDLDPDSKLEPQELRALTDLA